jgi:hypothetical protein
MGAGWRRAQRLTGKEHALSVVSSAVELSIESGARPVFAGSPAAAEAAPASEPPQGSSILSPRIHVRGIAFDNVKTFLAGRPAALAPCAVPGDPTGLK